MKHNLIHTVTLQRQVTIRDGGYTRTEWEDAGAFKSRFSNPSPSRIFAATGAPVPNISAVVFALPDLYSIIENDAVTKAWRLVSDDSGWKGEYDIQMPIRPYFNSSRLHHVEINCVRVQK